MSGTPERGGNGGGPNGRTAYADAGLLYERHAARIHRFCVRRLGDRDEAADAVQDTFLRAWLALENGVEVRHPLSWLLTIADNVCVSRFRARSVRVATTELSEETRGDFTDAVGEVAGLATALRALPVRQRRALLRREVQGYSYDEIGAELGVSRASVAALLHRARLAVADALRDVRRGVAALVPFPAILRAPFEGGAAAGAAVVGTTTVIAVAQLAGGPAPSSAAPPARPAVAAAAETVRLGDATRVQARGAHGGSGPEHASALGTTNLAWTGMTSPDLLGALPESSASEDLSTGPPTTTNGEPEPEAESQTAPGSESQATAPAAGDPEQHAEPEPTQPAGAPDSDGATQLKPTGKHEKGAKGRSASAPGQVEEAEGAAGEAGGEAGEDPRLPPQARGNGPPRDDKGDVAPPEKADHKPESSILQGQGNGKSPDKDDGAVKGDKGKGDESESAGSPSSPSA